MSFSRLGWGIGIHMANPTGVSGPAIPSLIPDVYASVAFTDASPTAAQNQPLDTNGWSPSSATLAVESANSSRLTVTGATGRVSSPAYSATSGDVMFISMVMKPVIGDNGRLYFGPNPTNRIRHNYTTLSTSPTVASPVDGVPNITNIQRAIDVLPSGFFRLRALMSVTATQSVQLALGAVNTSDVLEVYRAGSFVLLGPSATAAETGVATEADVWLDPTWAGWAAADTVVQISDDAGTTVHYTATEGGVHTLTGLTSPVTLLARAVYTQATTGVTGGITTRYVEIL